MAGCPSSHQPTRIREETLESGGPLQRKLNFRLCTVTCSEKCNQDFTSSSKSGTGNKVTIKPGHKTNTQGHGREPISYFFEKIVEKKVRARNKLHVDDDL